MNFSIKTQRYFSMVLVLLLGGLTSSCEESNLLEYENEAVLEAYIYANAPIDSIHVSALLPFGAELEDIPSTENLDLFIEWQGKEYSLMPMPGGAGYYEYTGNELAIQAGEEYRIHFVYNAKTISASTIIPSPPVGLSMGEDDIEIEQVVFGGGRPQGGFSFQQLDPIEIIWDNPNQEHHFIVVENIESNPESIFVDLPFERNFNFITEPTASNVFLLQPRILEQFGTHRIILYRVNKEYVDLYENREQDSRNLTEPLSNVENGLGIFTGFNSDTLYLEVKKQ